MSTTIRLPRSERPTTKRNGPLGDGQKRKRRVPVPDLERLRAWVTSPAFLGWVAARVAILASLAFARFLVNELGAADPAGRPPSGLIGWDAVWYVRIVRSGYSHLPWESMRFFPLLPILGTIVKPLLGARGGVLVVVNVAALASGVMLARLARHERADDGLASRAALYLALLPPAFVFVMGYAEALFVLFAICTFYALRTERFGWAIVAGILCGLSRPLGILLVLPAVVECMRGWHRVASPRERVARVAAAIAPALGMGAYLAFSGIVYGDPTRPLTVQQAFDRRGSFEFPITRLIEAGRQLAGGTDIGSGLHLPWAIGFLLLLVVLFRRWPVSYGLFAGAILVSALSAQNLDSLERYGLSAFPLVLAFADVVRQRWAATVVLPLCGVGLIIYSTLAFLGAYVP